MCWASVNMSRVGEGEFHVQWGPNWTSLNMLEGGAGPRGQNDWRTDTTEDITFAVDMR